MYYMWGRTKSSRWMQCSLGSMLTLLSLPLHHALAENAIYVSSRWWRMGFRPILIVVLNQSITGQSWLLVKSGSRIKLISRASVLSFVNLLACPYDDRATSTVDIRHTEIQFIIAVLLELFSSVCYENHVLYRHNSCTTHRNWHFLTCGISLVILLLFDCWLTSTFNCSHLTRRFVLFCSALVQFRTLFAVPYIIQSLIVVSLS